MNTRKLESQAQKYEQLVADARVLFRTSLKLSRSLLVARQLEKDINNKGSLIIPQEFARFLRNECMRSICVRLRTMLDESDDSHTLVKLMRGMKSHIGLLSEGRRRDARKIFKGGGDRSKLSHKDAWGGATSPEERMEFLDELISRLNAVQKDVLTWISQAIAHDVMEKWREGRQLMEGNITTGAEECVRIARQAIEMLADIDPWEEELHPTWRFTAAASFQLRSHS